LYLRQVHYFDYYSATEFETEDALIRKYPELPLRMVNPEPSPDSKIFLSFFKFKKIQNYNFYFFFSKKKITGKKILIQKLKLVLVLH